MYIHKQALRFVFCELFEFKFDYFPVILTSLRKGKSSKLSIKFVDT